MPDASAAVIASLAGHGLLGTFCLILLFWGRGKDKELSEEKAARIADAQRYNDLSLALQAKVLTAVETLNAIWKESRSKGG